MGDSKVANVDQTGGASVTGSPIAAGFNAWFPADDLAIRAALREGLVVVDTNVLLSLYKYDKETTGQWFDILESLGDRLFIPYQVLLEFWRNRDKLAAAPEDARKSAKMIRTHASGLEQEYRAWATANGLTLKPDQEGLLAELAAVTARMSAEVEEALADHRRRFDALPARDEVVRRLASLTDRASGAAILGSALSPEGRDAAMRQGDERFAKEIPPGYMDDANNEKTSVGKVGETKYGDYLLWREALDQAKSFVESHPGGSAYVVLITGDRKQDWYREHATPQGEASILLPRTELVEEMKKVAGATYLQLLPSTLLRHAPAALNVTVSEAAISRVEAEGARGGTGDWLPDEFHLTQQRANIYARARIDRDGRRCRVLKGSLSRIKETPAIPAATTRLRKELVERGVLVLSTTNLEAYEFTSDYEFATTSAAASVVRAGGSNGKTWWLSPDGSTLASVLEGLEDEVAADELDEADEAEADDE